MKDFLVKESSQIVIYGQTTLFKRWVGDPNQLFEFYFFEKDGRSLDFLSIQKTEALSESESSDTELVFHKLISNIANPKFLKECELRVKDKDWKIRSYSKYVEISLDKMSVDQETSTMLKISKIQNAEQGTVIVRIKDFRIIQKIDYVERIITIAPLYPAIPKMRDAEGVELVEENE